MGTAGGGVFGSLRRRALLPAREIPSCLDPEVWFPTMDTGRIGTGRIVHAESKACKGVPQPDCQRGKPGCAADSQAPLFRVSPAGRGQGPEIPGHRLAEPTLGHLGSVLRKRWQQGHQSGPRRIEREIPAGICVRRTP